MNIVIMESLNISDEELNGLKAPFEKDGCTFKTYSRTSKVEEMIEEAKDADVIILANMPLPASVIAACPSLKFVDIAFTGVNHVAMDGLRERNITVSNASGYANEAVAELAIGMAISMMRNLREVEARCRAGQTKEGLVGTELMGKSVGIIGFGKIGSRSAELFHAFGCRILANDPTYRMGCPNYVEKVSKEELLGSSDIVLLHCPLNDSTRGMIDADALALMKPSSILINLARGPVVNSQALANALNHDKIAGACVDVFDKEPPLDADEPLFKAKNTLLTPHIAYASDESMNRRAKIVFENLRCFLDGSPINLVK